MDCALRVTHDYPLTNRKGGTAELVVGLSFVVLTMEFEPALVGPLKILSPAP